MQVKHISPKPNLAEHEFDFKVKVNYNNGAVTVVGPSHKVQIPTIQTYPTYHIPATRQRQNISYPFPPPPPTASQQIFINKNHLQYSPSFSASTASQSIPAQIDGNKIYKNNSDIFNSNVCTPQRITSQFQKYKEQFKNQLRKPKLIKFETQKQQQIDCVICEKKFKKQDFQYHLQLHRNARSTKKVNLFQPVAQVQNYNPIFPQPQENNNQKSYASLNRRTQPEQRNIINLQNPTNPQFLYSFHKNQSFQSQANSRNLNNNSNHIIQGSFGQSMPNSHNNSKVMSIHSVKQIQIGQSLNGSRAQIIISHRPLGNLIQQQAQIRQINSGIRYITQPNNLQILNNSKSSKQNSKISLRRSQQLPVTPFTHNSINLKSSQISNSSQFSSNSQKPIQSFYLQNRNILGENITQYPVLNQNIIINNTKNKSKASQELSKPFELIEQEESKIYEYFPDSGHYSLAQHRINPENEAKKNINFNYTQSPSGLLKNHKSPQNQIGIIRKIKSNDNYDARSELSQSSISSVKSQNEPLQSMSKDKIIQNFHGNKARIDLSKIIGMSEVLARQGVTSNSTIRQQYSNIYQNVNQQYRPQDRKILVAKSMIANVSQPPINNLTKYQNRSLYQNLQMISVQNRQIFRGTQVQERDFRGFDSVLNFTRSSKSSTKTKIPRNYLAVNDFINNGVGKQ